MRYIKVEDTIIVDSISRPYNGYIAFNGEVPIDIMSGCYRLIDGIIVHDEILHAAFEAQIAAEQEQQ